jgi:eukaryotic-like serine/threonine-protein kinase
LAGETGEGVVKVETDSTEALPDKTVDTAATPAEAADQATEAVDPPAAPAKTVDPSAAPNQAATPNQAAAPTQAGATEALPSRMRPLIPSDPRQLGRYQIFGRLGEGGMGRVYLGRTAGGPLVAIKVIRDVLAADNEFRRRFRGEVARAQQVPSFCTAEVLDADPDHEPPYLVVEYVDGPSLADVVEQRGPLTPANLHGLAVGMAAALAAIHGAGVIHRDLKPSNVLLAPGTPKVIDFGIARPVDASTITQNSGNHVVGTVSYMSPERFEASAAKTLSPAADIFAWGAVVAYAGTGRVPFQAESIPEVAVRIISDRPDIGGLTRPLRDIVEATLAKNPKERPTARQLLDLLTASHLGPAEVDLSQEPPADPARPGKARARKARSSQDARLAKTRPSPPSVPTAPVYQQVALHQQLAPHQQVAPPARRGGGQRAAVVGGIAAGLVVLLAGTALATGLIPAPWRSAAATPASTTSSTPSAGAAPVAVTSPSTQPSATPSGPAVPSARPSAAPPPGSLLPPGNNLVLSDPLTGPGNWLVKDDPANNADCDFADNRLVATIDTNTTSYRCPGPPRSYHNFGVFVDVTLLTPKTCAGIWFLFSGKGYLLEVCPEGFFLKTHGADPSGNALQPLGNYPFAPHLAPNNKIRVGIVVANHEIKVYRDRKLAEATTDSTFTDGRIVLGVVPDGSTETSYQAGFANINEYTLPD